MAPASAFLPITWSTGGQLGYYWVSMLRIARVREENGQRNQRLRDEHQRTSRHFPCATLVATSSDRGGGNVSLALCQGKLGLLSWPCLGISRSLRSVELGELARACGGVTTDSRGVLSFALGISTWVLPAHPELGQSTFAVAPCVRFIALVGDSRRSAAGCRFASLRSWH